jgi:SAM-dependent methyltransferase
MFEQSSFDLIYCSLVIHYVDDLNVLFKGFSRILKPGGIFVFSTDHPSSPVIKNNGVITGREVKSFFWDGYGLSMNVYVCPWNNITGSLEKNQFVIDKSLAPVPTEECKVKFPREYEQLLATPAFICIRAINRK